MYYPSPYAKCNKTDYLCYRCDPKTDKNCITSLECAAVC